MKAFTTVTSRVIALQRKDIDTDLILPAQFLTSISKGGYGLNLFRRLKDTDPNFPMNLPEFKDASILLADTNFGCGSSREHAVWALLEAGIKVVIAPSFADIFFGNSAKSGLLLVTLPQRDIDALFEDANQKALTLSVDLGSQKVFNREYAKEFTYDPFRKHCLLHGLEDIDYLLAESDQISKFRKNGEKTRFF